jgi:hypothetical protein
VIAEPPRDFPREGGRLQLGERRRDRRLLGEDDGRDMRRADGRPQRKLRERSAGQEMLQRRVVVRLLMRDRTDDAALAIGVADRGDRSAPAQRAVPPLRRDHELRTVARARAEGDEGAILVALDPRVGRCGQDDAAPGIQAAVEGYAEATGLDHPSERSLPKLAMVEMEEERRGRTAGLAV